VNSETNRSETSFQKVYETHFDAIFRYVLHRVASVAEAEDLTSQTFFKAMNALGRFRWKNGSVSAWLYRIANNELANHFRRAGRQAASPVPPVNGVRQELETAEHSMIRSELFRSVNQALRTLRPDEQALIVLRYFEQKPFGEIAAILGKRPGALTMRTRRVLGKLKNELESRGIDHEEIREVFDRPAEARC
jgi:RNA polymerase sigma-70 factor (ECF subfamily)